MWTPIKNIEQVNNIKISDFLLKYPTDDDKAVFIPSGKEVNSSKYRVETKYIDSFELEGALSITEVAGMTVASMKRQIKFLNLVDGTWWIDK